MSPAVDQTPLWQRRPFLLVAALILYALVAAAAAIVPVGSYGFDFSTRRGLGPDLR